MSERGIFGANSTQLFAYYSVVLLALLYMLNRYKKDKVVWYFILLFFNGLFAYYGKDVQNIYRIVLMTLGTYGFLNFNLFNNNKPWTTISFIIFSLTFISTAIFNDDYFSIIFSQYSRYYILFAVFLYMVRFYKNDKFKNLITRFIHEILVVQIILTFFKFIFMGATESIVGSISFQGGAMATTLPLLGFMFIWLKRGGKLNNKDWLFVIGLLFIGFVSLKRTIWFIMPIVIGLFMFYIPGKKISPRFLLIGILIIPIVFYIGVRLDPSLNKENKIGGAFDLDYTINYANMYMFGKGVENKNNHMIYGRGGATIYIITKLIEGKISEKELFGYGLRFMYATDYGEFSELGFGLNHKGSATGIFQTMITNGYINILTFIVFVFSILIHTQNKRIRNVIFAFFIWEYFFYTGAVLREPALSLILIYIVLFSDTYVRKVKIKVVNFSKLAHVN